MSDIEKSFTFLHENVPSWFTHLAEIEEKVTKMQDEIEKVPVSVSPPMRRKTGSIESIRDINMNTIPEEPSMSTNAQLSPFASTRKRKTTSVLSGQASGPLKYRTRTMIIVYYDGQIQKQFETLVRNIGTGRNMLRKGKMAAKMQSMAELAAFSGDDSEDDDDDPQLSKVGYRPRPGLSTLRATRARAQMRGLRGAAGGASSRTTPELFDTTDKALEQAQGLCEKAAHQSLRDGDCRKELSGIKKHLEEVLETARKETAKYNVTKLESNEEPKMEAAPSLKVVESPKPSPVPKSDIRPIQTISHIAASKVIDIEVDDEEEDELDFVMPPIRLTSRA